MRGLTVECFVCNEGTEDPGACAQDWQRELRYEKRSRCVPGEFCFSLSREEPDLFP
ncbi:hypothetical protein KTT_07900 [Tengunoibacter tsumagoiensis]|uniref:Uncharacterized protein n=1 Tax=Tengunoibacter tsumagoiensis TaxID=2014871 RepID=A0A401ZVK8_9CHLR|nr:hypothetical protein KTT_07900 [Tengunoibacter tsumagoiensis]